MAQEEETLPVSGALIGLVLMVAIAVILVSVGWLSCQVLLPARPFTY
jgi:hypothetical protein